MSDVGRGDGAGEDEAAAAVDSLFAYMADDHEAEKLATLQALCSPGINLGWVPSYPKIGARVAAQVAGQVCRCAEIQDASRVIVRADEVRLGTWDDVDDDWEGKLVGGGRYDLVQRDELRLIIKPLVEEIGSLLDEASDRPDAGLISREIVDPETGDTKRTATRNTPFLNVTSNLRIAKGREVSAVMDEVIDALPVRTIRSLAGGVDQFPFLDGVVTLDWHSRAISRRHGWPVHRVIVSPWGPEHEMLGKFPIAWDGERNDLGLRLVRRLCGEDEYVGGPVSECVFAVIGEGFVLRRKEVGLLLCGDAGTGKTTVFRILRHMFGSGGLFDVGESGSVRGAKLDEASIMFGDGRVGDKHPSGTQSMLGTSAVLVDDVADASRINPQAIVMFISPGGPVSTRGMGKAFIDGFAFDMKATFFMQANGTVGFERPDVRDFIERRVLGVHCAQAMEEVAFREEVLDALDDPAAMDRAARGLARYSLPLVGSRTVMPGLEDPAFLAWNAALLEAGGTVDVSLGSLGLLEGGDDDFINVDWLVDHHVWPHRKTVQRMLKANGRIGAMKTSAPKRLPKDLWGLHEGKTRVTWIQGATHELPSARLHPDLVAWLRLVGLV